MPYLDFLEGNLQSLELSWSRTQKRFRWIDQTTQEESLCYEADGLFRLNGTNNVLGRLHTEGELEVDSSEIAHIWYPWYEVEIPEGAVEIPMGNRTRICFNRAKECWRVRDEDGTRIVYFAKDLEGLFNLDWKDHVGHLFHIGKVYGLGTAPEDPNFEKAVFEKVILVAPKPITCEW